jgi:hypothetical protein
MPQVNFGGNMEQGSSASALAARTAGMTDEQIFDLDLEQISADPGPGSSGPQDDMAILNATSSTAPRTEGFVNAAKLIPGNGVRGEEASRLGAVSSLPGAEASPASPVTPVALSTPTDASAVQAQAEPAWLKQLEAQPAAAAEARQWREAAENVAALDAAYFSVDPGARSGLATRLYASDPAAFREMLSESARVLAARDPQALAELARLLAVSEAHAPNGAAKSLAQAARSPEFAATQNQISQSAFPAEAYRTFESATNDDVARTTREAIDRTLGSALPEGIGEGARRRIGDDIFHELHATLSADRELSRQVGDILRGWHFDGATRQQVASLISSRARAAMPEVARRVVAEWTSSVLASDRARAARVDAATSRHDITGGRLPATIPASALRPRNVDYSRMSDEQILDL